MSGPYRIQAVAELTGLTPATLRAWERRYGVPRPARSDSDYRLYSDADLVALERIKALVAGGLATAEAAEQVQREGDARPVALTEAPSSHFQLARDRIVEAVVRMDPEAVHRQVNTSLLLGSGLEIAEEVLAPALREMGRRWHEGTLAIAAEHLGAEAVGNALRELLRLAQPPSTSPLALLACFFGEEHTLPLYLVGLRLATWGRRVEVLGSGLSPEALAVAIERLDPSLVGLSVTRPPQGGQLDELLASYDRACGGRPWVVGGSAAEMIRSAVEQAGGWVATSVEEIRWGLESGPKKKRSVP